MVQPLPGMQETLGSVLSDTRIHVCQTGGHRRISSSLAVSDPEVI